VSRSALKAVGYRYGPVVLGVAAALGVSFALVGYVYPRPMILIALVVSIWGRGLAPGLVGAGLATVAVSLAFPELVPKYGMVSDAAMFGLAAVASSALSSAKLRAEAQRRGVEQQLRESEERFRAIFFRAGVGIAQIGLQGEWQLVNDQLCEILGYTRAELCNKTFPQVTHVDDREQSLTAMRELLEDEPSFLSRQLRLIRKDGTICWASLCVSLVRDQSQYFIAVVEDITDRVEAERTLREMERRLTLVQSVARLGVWDRDLRTNTIATYGDYARLHGLEPGHPPLTYEKWLAMIHPADRERMQRNLRESIELTRVWDREFRVLWPDGSVHWLLAKGTVYVDDAGRPLGMAGVSLDITERKETEAALRESEERFRRVFEECPLGVALVGKDYRFLKVNSALCRMVGYAEAELTQMSFVDITYPEDLDANTVLAERLFRREIPRYWLHKRYLKKNSEIIWVNLTASIIRDEEGLPLYALAMIEDITESQRAQEEALARQKLESLGVLAGGIAHDFNNLLGSILAEAELAETNLSTGSSPSEELQRIMTIAVRGAEIVRELMIYAGQDKTQVVAPLDLSLLVEEMLELLKVSISKHVVLKTDLSKDLPAVLGNAPQLRQVVMNLIINAAEAIGEQDAAIGIRTSRVTSQDLLGTGGISVHEGYVRLTVSDTGCGMTDEVQARVFDPFFSTKFAGRGLGLAVVQGVVRDHGGVIHLVSAPGHGTTFEVLLPCTGGTAQSGRDAIAQASGEERRAPAGTLLVVEDEEALRLAVSKMLRKNGFRVIEAIDGSSALELIRTYEDEIDLMLLDVTLPGVPSREVFEEARLRRPVLKVILTSAYSRETAEASLAGLRIEHFIRKPFQLVDLMGVLQDALPR
jgi:two-component system, cell cycle sensor histidine kinase and response regulator CckA